MDISTTFNSNNYRFYGINPYLFETMSEIDYDRFISIHYSNSPGLQRIGEMLYTKSGS